MENGRLPPTCSFDLSHSESAAIISRISSASGESVADEYNRGQKNACTTSNNDIKREEQNQHRFDETTMKPATLPRKTKKADCADLHRINTKDDTKTLQRNRLSSSPNIVRKNVRMNLKDNGCVSSTLVTGDNNITTTLLYDRGIFNTKLNNGEGNVSITHENDVEKETLPNNNNEGKTMPNNSSEKKVESNNGSESKTMPNFNSGNVITVKQNCGKSIACITPKNNQADINLTQKNGCGDMNMTQCHINGCDNKTMQDIDSKITTEFTLSNDYSGSNNSVQSKSNADASTSSENKDENVDFSIDTETKIFKGIDDAKSTLKSNNHSGKFGTKLNHEKQNFEVLLNNTTGLTNLSNESCKVEAKINNNANETVSKMSESIKDICNLVHKPNDGDFKRQLRIDDEKNTESMCRTNCGNKHCMIANNDIKRNDLTSLENNLNTSCVSIDATQTHFKQIDQCTNRYCTEGGNECSSNKTDDRPALVISCAKYVHATSDSVTDTDLKGTMACNS